MNVIHMRIAAIGSGIVVMAFFFMMGGSFGQPEVIQIDYSMFPDLLEGAEVEIDGRVVGKLRATGQTTRAGFEVKEGKHVIRVLTDEMPSEEIAVEVRKDEKVRVMLDMVTRYDKSTRQTSSAIGGYY